LAGGRGLRLGRNKALELLDHQTFIRRTVETLSALGTEIIVVTGLHNQELGIENINHVRVVLDAFPGRGPLVGVYTGLLNSRTEKNLVVACDMPFLNPNLIRHMSEIASGYDAVVPRLGDEIEPLHSVYGGACLAETEKLLGAGVYSVSELFKRVNVRYIEGPEIDRFDPQHLSFFNINTETELERARAILHWDGAGLSGVAPAGSSETQA
jgi:molybdopterin-guanine dinucleotide biosynthesis protein A